MGSIFVQLINFQKYKGRKDVTHNSWFRCSNRLLEDPDFFTFTHSEILVWVYILSLSSQKNSAIVEVHFDHAERVCRLKKTVVQKTIQKLMGKQILPVDDTLTSRGRNVDVTLTCATRQDKTEQDITNITVSADVRAGHVLQHTLSFPDLEYFHQIEEINPALIEAWVKAYPEDWITAELTKAKIWCLANPKKKPKRPGPFLTNWFSRGWETYRKSIPSERKQKGFDVNEIELTPKGSP